MSLDRFQALRELLAFYHEAGVDTLIGDGPVDWLTAERAPKPAPATPGPLTGLPPHSSPAKAGGATLPTARKDLPARSNAITPPTPEAAIMAARQLARTAQNLDELRALLAK